MRIFDTKVQHLKYKVLREVARLAFKDQLLEHITDIPKTIFPDKDAHMSCCIYKDRAIASERVKLAVGGDSSNPNVIEVIGIACDECPVGGYEVSNACRGCIAHRCQDACPKGAIYLDHQQKAHIDKDKCIDCGLCAKACPYTAIANHKRPCQNACKVQAVEMNPDRTARIDNSKCVACGACVYQCPFGAIMDKSYILNVIDILKKSEENKKYKTYAVIAPSISSQFSYAKLGQVIAGIKELGFFTTVEAALGADMVAWAESEELVEKGFLTSSCCPAFVDYIHKNHPDMVQHISHNLSPAATISKYIKSSDPTAQIVFIGPCTAKKMEYRKPEVRPYIDSVITFEELQALFDGKGIEITELREEVLDNASYFGRIFARSGGLSDAVKEGLIERGHEEFALNACSCDGIEACKVALLKASKGINVGNFIEGMACEGGCIGGAGCLTHGVKNKAEVDQYGKQALEKTIRSAISTLDLTVKK